jgi:hypothetical protein
VNVQHRRAPRASNIARVFRLQDREGRGPFRPGFSSMWLDEDVGARAALPSWIEEFGADAFERLAPKGSFGFSAVRTIDKLRDWFTDAERQRLYGFGFFLVEVPHANIICESEHQVLAWRSLPLNFGVMNRRPI